MKSLILTLALATAFGAAGGTGVPSEAEKAHWRRLKLMQARASSQDVATNVKAEQIPGSKQVRVTYDLNYKNGWPVNVTLLMTDRATGVDVPVQTVSGDVGKVPSGVGKSITWDAGADWNGEYTEQMVATVNAIPAEHPSSWAEITISWSSFGGRDLDVCGYWTQKPGVKVGFGWQSGDTTSTYLSSWYGDNTGSGPEHIAVGVKPSDLAGSLTRPTYEVHCNYYGENGSPAKATISVSCNGLCMSKTISTATRNGTRAEASDPGVVITFDNEGNLVSIQ